MTNRKAKKVPRCIDEDKDAIYHIYESICDSSLEDWKKNSLLTTLMGGYTSSWKVVGVSEGARRALVAFNKNESKKKEVTRAHIYPRFEVARTVFSNKLDKKALFELFTTDFTILAGKGENKKNMSDSLLVYPINTDCDLFCCLPIGFRYDRGEREWVKNASHELITLAELKKRLEINPPSP